MTFDIPSAAALALDAAFWSLYDAAFPAEEREPRDVILGSVESGTGVAVRALDETGTVGLATTHLLRDPPAVFLVYIATRPELRGGGLGARLFDQTWTASAERARSQGFEPTAYVWEVDDPDRAQAPEEIRRRVRRIGFFTRLGGRLLPGRYLQPPVNGVEAVPMLLMARAAPGAEAPAARDLARAIYSEKYGAANGIPRSLLEGLLARAAGEEAP